KGVDWMLLLGVGEDDFHGRQHSRPPFTEKSHGEFPTREKGLYDHVLFVLLCHFANELAKLRLCLDDACMEDSLGAPFMDRFCNHWEAEILREAFLSGCHDHESGGTKTSLRDEALCESLVESKRERRGIRPRIWDPQEVEHCWNL